MPRPKKCRRMHGSPVARAFVPDHEFQAHTHSIELLMEEYEAIRLSDYTGMSHQQAAEQMNVSRPTLTRILQSARKKIASAIIDGYPIVIAGGTYQMNKKWYYCDDCRSYFPDDTDRVLDACNKCNGKNIIQLDSEVDMPQGRNQRHGQGGGMGSGGQCVCPKCGKAFGHTKGIPCAEETCPECGGRLVREDSYHHQLIQKKQNEKKD